MATLDSEITKVVARSLTMTNSFVHTDQSEDHVNTFVAVVGGRSVREVRFPTIGRYDDRLVAITGHPLHKGFRRFSGEQLYR
jgi:hypothetical protein